MKLISLTQGLFAQVDDEDFDRLNQFKWFIHKSKNSVYAARKTSRTLHPEGKQKVIKMHQDVLGGKWIDHIDGNGLNNQKINLRFANNQQNTQNSKKRKGSSRYKGVCWRQSHQKWLAQICVNGKKIHIGLFDLEIRAAEAYDSVARLHFGEFAKTNFEEK